MYAYLNFLISKLEIKLEKHRESLELLDYSQFINAPCLGSLGIWLKHVAFLIARLYMTQTDST